MDQITSAPENPSAHRAATRQLPVLNTPSRPTFGSPEVASYGAVGLPVDVCDEPASARSSSASAPPQSTGANRTTHRVSPTERLPIVDDIAHHQVDDDHLWIAVEDGKVVVASDAEHEMMRAYADGCSPRQASARVERALRLDSEAAWQSTVKFIGRLAAAGFIKGIEGYHTVKQIKPHLFARFHLTQRCQLECIHCYTNSSPHLPRDKELSTARWIQLVDDFADNGGQKILFTGGEALVHPGCIPIMRRAHERGLDVMLFSNGILIPRHIDVLKQIVNTVQISIDGPSAETHDEVRGPGSFKKAMRAIRMLLDAGIKTRISTVVMMNNWPAIQRDLPTFMGGFADTDVTFRISYGAMPFGRGANLDHSLDTDEVRRFVDEQLRRSGKGDDRDFLPNVTQRVSGCGYAEQLVIAPDGIVYPCHLMSGALGHVDDLPLKEITRYLTRTAEAFDVDHRKGCSTCDLRHLCGGSCRVEDEMYTGSRLSTTCTPDDKLRKKRFLVRRYRPTV